MPYEYYASVSSDNKDSKEREVTVGWSTPKTCQEDKELELGHRGGAGFRS
jgi:hypothetical protein